MNPASPLQLGDHVEIIGPGYDQKPDCEKCNRGKRIQIVDILPGGLYAAESGPWYPASSLRKVEELQIGDWVEVIGPCDESFGLFPGYEKKFVIARQGDGYGHWYMSATFGEPGWPASSLQKLTPDEIQQGDRRYDRLERDVGNSISKVHARLSAIEERHDKIVDCLRGLATPTHGLAQIAELHEERFDDIDERQESIDSYITRIVNVGAALGKRLAFVEAFQKEQTENAPEHKPLPRADPTLAAMIADGTLEVADFRKKDIKTQRKIIRELEEDLANGCNGMTCAECVDEVEDIRMAALDYAIRALRMPDMDNDPEFAHEVADVLEGMLEEVEK